MSKSTLIFSYHIVQLGVCLNEEENGNPINLYSNEEYFIQIVETMRGALRRGFIRRLIQMHGNRIDEKIKDENKLLSSIQVHIGFHADLNFKPTAPPNERQDIDIAENPDWSKYSIRARKIFNDICLKLFWKHHFTFSSYLEAIPDNPNKAYPGRITSLLHEGKIYESLKFHNYHIEEEKKDIDLRNEINENIIELEDFKNLIISDIDLEIEHELLLNSYRHHQTDLRIALIELDIAIDIIFRKKVKSVGFLNLSSEPPRAYIEKMADSLTVSECIKFVELIFPEDDFSTIKKAHEIRNNFVHNRQSKAKEIHKEIYKEAFRTIFQMISSKMVG